MQINQDILDALKSKVLSGPTPAAGEEFFRLQREKRFIHSPEARENWDRYQTWFGGDSQELDPHILPMKAYISPISQCNFRCTMCAVSDFPRGKRAEPMSLKHFLKRLDQMPTVIEMSPVGLSELLMADQTELVEMLRAARSREMWVQLVTNGSLLHQKNWIASLVDLDLNEYCVSLDGVTKEVFEGIRRGSNFEGVVKNTESFVKALRNKTLGDRIKVQVVLQRSNLHQLENFIPFIHGLGVQSVTISIDIFDWGSEVWRLKNNSELAYLSVESLNSVVEDGKSRGIKVGITSIHGKFSVDGPKNKRCQWPFMATVISSDDRFVPCCHISNPDYFEIEHSLGSEANVERVWNSDSYRKFRLSHLEGNIPNACSSCYSNGGLSHEVSVSIKS